MWLDALEGVHGQSLDAFTVQSGWERVCGRVVVGGGPGPATIQGHGRLAPTLHCVRFELEARALSVPLSKSKVKDLESLNFTRLPIHKKKEIMRPSINDLGLIIILFQKI